jgi:hypothetical protein
MPKRNNFVEGLRRRQQRASEEAAAASARKDVAEMSREELERELARAQVEKRVRAERASETKVLVERAAPLLPSKKRKPSWK